MRVGSSSSRPGWGAVFASALLASVTLAYSPHNFASPAELARRSSRPRLHRRQAQELPEGAEIPEGIELPEGSELPEGMEMEMPVQLPEAQYVNLPLDHFDSENKEIFKNRYWIEDSAYKSGGPVIFWDLGEIPGEVGARNHDIKFPMSIANKTGGVLVMFEHRFYGQSKPKIESSVIEKGNLAKYLAPLTIENSLEDVVVFSKQFTHKNQTLHPGKTPWIFVGGSYPGARGAWLRERNPEIIYASLAGAAVVEVQRESKNYYLAIEDALKVDYSNCTADLIALAEWQNDVYVNQDKPAYEAWLKAIGATEGSTLLNHFKVLGGLQPEYWEEARTVFKFTTDVLFGEYQSQGFTEEGAVGLCNEIQAKAIKAHKRKAAHIESKGIVATLGWKKSKPLLDTAIKNLWAGYMEMITIPGAPPMPTLEEIETGCAEGDEASCSSYVSATTWFWQGCSEFGNIVTAGNGKITPAYATIEKLTEDCVYQFGEVVANGPSLKMQKYGGLKINPSNVFFTDGGADPVRDLTPNSGASGRVASSTIPKSGVTLSGDQFFGHVANGSHHTPHTACSAFLAIGETKINDAETREYNDGYPGGCTAEVTAGQQLFLDALDIWLPEFKPHSLDNSGEYGTPAPGNSTPSPTSPGEQPDEPNAASSYTWKIPGVPARLRWDFAKNHPGSPKEIIAQLFTAAKDKIEAAKIAHSITAGSDTAERSETEAPGRRLRFRRY